ncbi:uncharacterized protein LOC130208513 [Pseudoliparis swirei]|uniref:uncharacterized protein LOC130208513 n=1 Tax=Pseudoliparis swirei TaxID=2059687 RepID=UPI0024BE0532|nr:uncharacterized protein LOC130208513 [Pseudoliparis swirei]
MTDLLEQRHAALRGENRDREALCSRQRGQLTALRAQASGLQVEIREKLKLPGDALKQREKHGRDMKSIEGLEEHLEQETVRFDALMSSNAEQRLLIAHLLQQRGVLGAVNQKLNEQLEERRKTKEKMEEKSSLVFTQRSAAATRTLAMEKGVAMETGQFVRRRSQLKTIIARDAKLQRFLQTKLQRSVPLEGDGRSKKRKEQRRVQAGVERLDMYVRAHRALLEVTGETDLRRIGLVFTRSEHQNLSYLGYVNELHGRSNALRSGAERLEREIWSLEEQNRGRDDQNQRRLQDLESELQASGRLSESLQQQSAALQAVLDRLAGGIAGLLDDITQEVVVVNADNIVHFTHVLEESVVHLLVRSGVDGEQPAPAPPSPMAFDPLSDVEAVRSKSPARSLKSA